MMIYIVSDDVDLMPSETQDSSSRHRSILPEALYDGCLQDVVIAARHSSYEFGFGFGVGKRLFNLGSGRDAWLLWMVPVSGSCCYPAGGFGSPYTRLHYS